MKRMQCRSTRVPGVRRNRRGFVLIIVMVIVSMVAFAGFAFVNTMTDEYRAVHTNGDLLIADQALASAEMMLINVLEHRGPTADSGRDAESFQSPMPSALDPATGSLTGPDALTDNPQLFGEQQLFPAGRDEQPRDDPFAWRFSIVSPRRSTATDDLALEENAGVRFGLENESARLSFSTLMSLDAADPVRSREVLMAFPGMTQTAADSLLDWLDADDEPREFGAEAEDYLSEAGSYQPRNGIPATFDELLLVREVTRSRLFGPDQNRNFVVEPHERQMMDQPGVEQLGEVGGTEIDPATRDLGWADLLTFHSAERNVSSSGEPRINLNLPNEAQLREQLAAHFPQEVVDYVIQYRQSAAVSGAASGASSSAQPSSESRTSPGARTSPAGAEALILISSIADLIDASEGATSGSSSNAGTSPVSTSSRELLSELLDRTTTDPREVIPGRININLAPRPVLMAIPGLDAEVLDQLLARREALDKDALRTPAWLLTEQIVTLEQFRQMLPHITTGGDVFRAQLIAWRPAGGPYRRVEVVIDATEDPARRIVWNDLSAYGAAIPVARLLTLDASGQSLREGAFR